MNTTYYVLLRYDHETQSFEIRCRGDIFYNPNIEVLNDTTVNCFGRIYTIVYSDDKRVAEMFTDSLRLSYYGARKFSKDYRKHRAKMLSENT